MNWSLFEVWILQMFLGNSYNTQQGVGLVLALIPLKSLVSSWSQYSLVWVSD